MERYLVLTVVVCTVATSAPRSRSAFRVGPCSSPRTTARSSASKGCGCSTRSRRTSRRTSVSRKRTSMPSSRRSRDPRTTTRRRGPPASSDRCRCRSRRPTSPTAGTRIEHGNVHAGERWRVKASRRCNSTPEGRRPPIRSPTVTRSARTITEMARTVCSRPGVRCSSTAIRSVRLAS